MKLAEHQPLLRQCAAVIAVLALCAGGIAWLHARAAPERRQRSPAELALARRLPEIKLKNVTLGEVLRAVNDGSVEFDTKALDDEVGLERYDFWCPAGTTLEAALRKLQRGAYSGVHFRPDGHRLILNRESTAPRMVRIFDVGSLIDSLCAEVPESSELPWPMPSAREQVRRDIPRIACCRIWREMTVWKASFRNTAS